MVQGWWIANTFLCLANWHVNKTMSRTVSGKVVLKAFCSASEEAGIRSRIWGDFIHF